MLGLEGRMKVMQFTHFSVKEFMCLATSSRESPEVVSHHAKSQSNWRFSTARPVLDHIAS